MCRDCPLCLYDDIIEFSKDKRRTYYRCTRCYLVFVDPANRLSPLEEKAIYDQHENDLADVGYRHFLSRFSTPVLSALFDGSQDVVNPPLTGLDFGSGPGPLLASMLEEAGICMSLYDPYYAPCQSVLKRQYDLVTCTEAIEHFYTPHKEWALLLSLVKPNAWLAVMTKLVKDADAFSRWHYKNDLTHVSFFSQSTFNYLAKRDGLLLRFVGDDVVLMRKMSK